MNGSGFQSLKIALIFSAILIVAGLLFASPAFGAVSYSRTPAGYTIQNPVSFYVSLDTYEEVCTEVGYQNFWGIAWVGSAGEGSSGSLVASTTLSYDFNENLPIGEYTIIQGICWGEDLEDPYGFDYAYLENGGDTIFEVVAPPPAGGNIITLPEDFGTGFLAFAGTLFTDLLPLILIAIGLPLAFWVVGKAIKLTKFFE
jgi:hypothetical protein